MVDESVCNSCEVSSVLDLSIQVLDLNRGKNSVHCDGRKKLLELWERDTRGQAFLW